MYDFDQALIERQVCLVLGTGGIGQNVALNLARLGVAEIILLDNDVYDLSNLTRQVRHYSLLPTAVPTICITGTSNRL